MGRFLLGRLGTTIVVLAIVSLISFSIMHLVPGDPALVLAGVGAPADTVRRIRADFGLDQPTGVQMLRWYGGLLRGDFGQSVMLGRGVTTAIGACLPPTLSLTLVASVISLVAGIGAGIVAALDRGGWRDRIITGFAVLGLSMPSFWLGLLLIVLFAVRLDWLPAGGYVRLAEGFGGWLRALVLPGVSLALLQIGYVAQITRAALLETLGQDFVVVRGSVLVVRRLDFVEAARAMGAGGSRVLLRHILPNCLGPLLVQLTFVFAYAILSEAALSFLGMGTPPPTPTLGTVIADGRDYVREAPWICFYPGMVLLCAVLGLNLLGDGLRELLDPRRAAVSP